jgi:hypothetical protein
MAKTGRKHVPEYLSPYELWNFGRGKGYAPPGIRKFKKYITALAEFPPEKAAATNKGDASGRRPRRSWLPTLWHEPGLTFVPFVVEGPAENAGTLQQLLRGGLRSFIGGRSPYINIRTRDISTARFRVAFPVPDHAMHENMFKPSGPKWHPEAGLRDRVGRKKITIVAVIDEGLPFAHRNFRDESGRRTRVEFCWLQSVAKHERQKSVLFGREYTRDQIEDYIARFANDEDRLYREAGATCDTEGLPKLVDRHATHGGHVMDLAAGYARERGEVPVEEIRIIVVQLPNTIAWDTSGFGKDMYMLSAFHYIFDRADIIARGYGIDRPRLVINFSYGFSGGRHDGGTELEAAINQLIDKRRDCRGPTALVLPAGNTFIDRLHGKFEETDFKNDIVELPWRIQPNDRTPCYLEIWFWQDFVPVGYSIELFDPWDRPVKLADGAGNLHLSLPVTADPASTGGDPRRIYKLLDADREQVGQVSSDHHRSDRWRVLVVMAPTEPNDPRLPGVAPGKWRVVIWRGRHARLLDHPIHCWIQRSVDPELLRSGSRQSYFDDPEDYRYNLQGDLNEEDTTGAFVHRFGSLNGLATERRALDVAGYRLGAGLVSTLKDARPSLYSSAGTLEPGWPDAHVAVSSMADRSRVLPGTIAAGVRSGSLSLVQGTSSAAPFVARQLATIFTTASNHRVRRAEPSNYSSLLRGYRPKVKGAKAKKKAAINADADNETRARLGVVRVPPHWQPGVDVK